MSHVDSLIKELRYVEAKGDTLAIARAYYRIGKHYDTLNQWKSSNESLQNALYFARLANSKKAIAVISNYLAGNYCEQGSLDTAINLYQESIQLFLELGDSVLAADIYLNLGSVYLEKGGYEHALTTYQFALNLKEQTKDSTNIAYYLQQIGEVYKELGMFELWETYISKAKKLSDKSERYANDKCKVAILNDLAGIEAVNGDTLKAFGWYNKMFSLSTSIEYDKGQYIALINMSNIYLHRNEYQKAIELARRAYQLSLHSTNKYNWSALGNHIAEYYLYSEQFKLATQWYNKSLQLSLGRYPDEAMRSYLGLYKASKKTNHFKKALYYIEMYEAFNDSIQDLAVKKHIRELEEHYQSERKSATILRLNQQNEFKDRQIKLQNTIIALVLLAVVLTIVFFLYKIRVNRLTAKNKELLLQQKLLRTQMNPHFIFNSLSVIQSFLYDNENIRAANYLGKFAALMRDILNHSRQELISIEEEINTLKHYFDLQQMRLHFGYTIKCSPLVNRDEIGIPPLLVQPFVENAIQHGIRHLGELGVVEVTFNLQSGVLVVIIEDNGVGIGTEKINYKNSLAIRIFSERVEVLSSVIGKKVSFKIINLSQEADGKTGTRIEVRLPILLINQI